MDIAHAKIRTPDPLAQLLAHSLVGILVDPLREQAVGAHCDPGLPVIGSPSDGVRKMEQNEKKLRLQRVDTSIMLGLGTG
jgi:hypothetical protein